MTTITLSRETSHHQASAKPSLFASIKDYVARKDAERKLHQLDDRMLADIGLSRGDIHRQVWR